MELQGYDKIVYLKKFSEQQAQAKEEYDEQKELELQMKREALKGELKPPPPKKEAQRLYNKNYYKTVENNNEQNINLLTNASVKYGEDTFINMQPNQPIKSKVINIDNNYYSHDLFQNNPDIMQMRLGKMNEGVLYKVNIPNRQGGPSYPVYIKKELNDEYHNKDQDEEKPENYIQSLDQHFNQKKQYNIVDELMRLGKIKDKPKKFNDGQQQYEEYEFEKQPNFQDIDRFLRKNGLYQNALEIDISKPHQNNYNMQHNSPYQNQQVKVIRASDLKSQNNIVSNGLSQSQPLFMTYQQFKNKNYYNIDREGPTYSQQEQQMELAYNEYKKQNQYFYQRDKNYPIRINDRNGQQGYYDNYYDETVNFKYMQPLPNLPKEEDYLKSRRPIYIGYDDKIQYNSSPYNQSSYNQQKTSLKKYKQISVIPKLYLQQNN